MHVNEPQLAQCMAFMGSWLKLRATTTPPQHRHTPPHATRIQRHATRIQTQTIERRRRAPTLNDDATRSFCGRSAAPSLALV